MLKRMHIENFKSWKRADLEFGAVTALFGTNSSGKSSLIQFLLMLKQTRNATDRGLVLDFGGLDQLVNLGGFNDVIYQHNSAESLSWKLDWSRPSKLSINDPTGKRTDVFASGNELNTSARVRLSGSTLTCDHLSYEFAGYNFALDPRRLGSTEYQLTANAPTGSDFRFIRNKARAWALPGPIKTYLFPDQTKTYFQNSAFLGQFEAEYESLFDSIFYLGPLREHPKREYPWSGASPTDVGLRGERAVGAILAATAKGEKRNLAPKRKYKSFQEMIAYWLKELALIQDFKIEEIGSGANLYRAVVRRDSGSPATLLTDVGFGVSQILPALVLLYYVPEGSTVIMEQPEIHLHPAVQSGLADVIIDVAKNRKLQVIIESHSEHILRRFQRRIAEGRHAAEDTKLYFCETTSGHSELRRLDLDIFGQIKNWPKDFFGDELTEIAETQKAALRRKRQSIEVA